MPFQSRDPVRRVHYRMGWQGRVFTHTYQGEDEDTGRDVYATDETGTPCTIRVEPAQRAPERIESSSGETTTTDTLIAIDSQEVDVSDGRGTQNRPSTILDETSGKRYEVLNVRNEHNGMLVCECTSET